MEIIYDNKATETDILNRAKDFKYSYCFNNNSSMLFKGENFKVLSLLLKDYRNKIDLIYIDPPFNTLQDFHFSENRANSISFSRKDEVAYSDKMIKEQYLEFIRERLVLLKELLSDKGSIYLHIDYKIGHYVKLLMDEIFGEDNFKNDITRVKSNPKNFYRKAYGNEKDLILFYVKNNKKNIWNDIRLPLDESDIVKRFSKVDEAGRRYTTIPLHAPGETIGGPTGQPWRNIPVPKGRHWRANPKEFDALDAAGKIEWSKTGNPRIKMYADEHEGKRIQDIWVFKDPQNPVYPTEKNSKMLQQIISQSSNEDSIVLDCFAGSGSTLKNAYVLNRKWIGIDNSEIAISIIRRNDIGSYFYYDIENNIIEQINNDNEQINF